MAKKPITFSKYSVENIEEAVAKVPQKFIKYEDENKIKVNIEPNDGYNVNKYQCWTTDVSNNHTHDFEKYSSRTTMAHGHTHEIRWEHTVSREPIVKVLYGGEDGHDHKPVPLKTSNDAQSDEDIPVAESVEELDEALSVSQRMAMGRSLKRNKAKLAIGRRKASRRLASKEVISKRTRRAVRSDLFKKLTKGVPKSELSPARKAELEKRLSTPAYQKRIDMLSKRKFKDVRKLEMDRKRGGGSKGKK